jgi:hypothetical protein
MVALLSARDFGAATIKPLILLNGAALIALVSYLASVAPSRGWLIAAASDEIGLSVVSFLIGLISAAIASGIGYINYSSIGESLPPPHKLTHYVEGGDVSGWSENVRRIATPTAWVAVGLATASVSAFSVGSWVIARAVVRIASGV